MNNNIQCSIESSTTKLELNSATEGVFLVPELEGLAGLPEIRTTSGVNAGYDGGWTSAQNYDARLITIRGVIANPDVSQVEAKRRAIASLLGQGRKEQLTLRITTDAGNSYAISVRTISCEMALQRVLTTQEFLIQLRADDPLIYDDGASSGTEAVLQVQRAIGGFEIDFELPLAIGGGAEDTIIENGDELIYPIINLYGPLHSPTVVNRTTNQQMQLLADLEYTINYSDPSDTVSGTYLTETNSLDIEAPLSTISLLGNAEQTTYSGKNLWKFGASYTNDTTTGKWVLSDTAVSIPAGTYTFSGTLSPSGATARFNCKYADNADNFVDMPSSGVVVVTFSEEVKKVALRLNSGNSTISNVQLEAGSTATAYEPYVGGTASPNPDYPQAIETVTGGQNIKVVGKNLFTFDGKTFLGGTALSVDSSSSNSLSVSSTSSAGSYSSRYVDYSLSELGLSVGDTFTLSMDITGTYTSTNGASMRLYWNNDTSSIIGVLESDSQPLTLTIPSGTTSITFYWYVRRAAAPAEGSVATFNNIQLELGSEATDYEEFQEQSYTIDLYEPNLFDISKVLDNGTQVVNNGDGTLTIKAYGGAAATPNTLATYCPTLQAGDVVTLLADTTSTNKFIYLSGTNASWNFGTSRTITATDLTSRVLWYSNDANTQATISNLKIAKPIELCKIDDYQDYIFKNTSDSAYYDDTLTEDAWYIHKEVGKVVLDGTESWRYTTSRDGDSVFIYYGSVFPLSGGGTAVANAMSDYFTASSYVASIATGSTNDNVLFFHDATPSLYIKASQFADATAFATWLASNPTTVYYALATPTDTEITDEALLEDLEALETIELYVGVNHITTSTENVQPTLSLKYYTDYSVDQGVAIIDSQARTITINGVDAYHLKSDASEFITLAPGDNKLYLTSETSDDTGYAEIKFKQGYLSI